MFPIVIITAQEIPGRKPLTFPIFTPAVNCTLQKIHYALHIFSLKTMDIFDNYIVSL